MPSPATSPASTPGIRRKGVAVWLALLGGMLGLHRLYLHGARDTWAWVWWLPTLLGAWGIWRARALGLDDRLSWLLIPWIGASFSAAALNALIMGLTPAAEWNRRQRPPQDADHPAGATHWLTVVALVLAVLTGATALIATIAFTAQHAFELAQA